MKKTLAFICIAIFVLILFCKSQNNDVFRAPTKEKTNKYLTENNISPIVVKNVDI